MTTKRNLGKSYIKERAKRKIDRERHPIEKLEYTEYRSYNAERMYNTLKQALKLARDRQYAMLKKMQYNKSTGKFDNRNMPIPMGYRRTSDGGQGWADFEFNMGGNWRYYRDPKNINQTRAFFRKVQMFLQNESSTIEGWKDILERTAKEVGEQFNIVKNDRDKYEVLWNIYNAISPMFSQAELESAGVYGKVMQEYIASVLNDSDYSNYTVDEIVEMIINQVDTIQVQGKFSFEDLDNELEEELKQYNKENKIDLTLAEYKQGVLNGEIQSKDNLFIGARKLQDF